MDKHEQYTTQLVSAIVSTLDEDSEFFIADVNDLDANEFFTGIITATTYLFNELTGDSKNNLEMTHTLNQLVVQKIIETEKEDN